MKRYSLVLGLAAAVALAPALSGCVRMGARAAFASARSARFDDGFFFGHDVRLYRKVVYVLDLSGSMQGHTGSIATQVGTSAGASVGGSLVGGLAGNDIGHEAGGAVAGLDQKVELVKDHLLASLRGLPPGSEFNVILFSNHVQQLAPSFVSASGLSTGLVSAFVAQLGAGGSTSLMSAIEAGLATDAEEVMVLTDGLPTDASPADILAMVHERQGGLGEKRKRIYSVGVGADQARDFLTRLAQDNGGKYMAYD